MTPTKESLRAKGLHHFSVDWFEKNISLWQELPGFLPERKKFLEVGSFEGRSACWMLENLLEDNGELFCIDTWEGSPEFQELEREIVKEAFNTFKKNISLSQKPTQKVKVLKAASLIGLASLFPNHILSFDLIYIDGGHFAEQTISDAIFAWPLLKQGGVMIFDDYLWQLQAGLRYRPKLGVDAFTTIFNSTLETLSVGDQYVVRKIV